MTESHARLQQLYQLGEQQKQLGQLSKLDRTTMSVMDAGADVGASNRIESNVEIGAFDWARRQYQRTVNKSNFKFVTTLAGLEGVHFGTKRVLCKNYVEYTHVFPPFMVKVKGLDTSKSEAKFITMHPLSVKVFNALTTTPSFMITELEENSTLSCVEGMIKDVCFEIADIDEHFQDVIKNMNLAYTYYEKEEKAWKRKHTPGRHDTTNPENTTPSFGTPTAPGGSSSMDPRGSGSSSMPMMW